MPDVYSEEWYAAVKEAMNASAARMRRVPEGSFVVAIEIAGDGASPYVQEGAERRFVVRIDDGRCSWYTEVGGPEDEHALTGGVLDYRFRGSASDFDALAAGLLDPIDAALRGTIKVRGDMRMLMRHAEQVKVLLEAYTSDVSTTWPLGAPPYGDRTSTTGEPVRA